MRIHRHTREWWFEPDFPKKKTRIPSRLRDVDPATSDIELGPRRKFQTGQFLPSRKWVPYHRLQAFDAGYVVPLYTLNDIAKRYGLSVQGRSYFKKNILPEPYGVVRRRSVSAHHWSRFVLMVLDVVMKDIERRGELRFVKNYADHVELVQVGVEWLEDHYGELAEQEVIKTTDRFGVQWF